MEIRDGRPRLDARDFRRGLGTAAGRAGSGPSAYNNIDAMIYTVGHPSGAIQEATTACDAVLVNVTGRRNSRR